MNSIAVVVLHYKNIPDTIRCLQSLTPQLLQNDRILVVDNCSDDSIFEEMQKEFPDIKVIKTSSNLGYAGGMNAGARFLLPEGFDYILLTNNDVEFEKDFLENIRPNSNDSEFGIISPKVLYFHDKSLIYCAGAVLNLLKVASINKFRGMKDKEFGSEAGEINTAEGCTMLINRKVFDDGFFFDENYFMYFEDADFSLRVTKKYKLFYQPRARVYHKSGAGISISSYSNLYHYYYTRNRLFFLKNFGLFYRIYGVLFSFSVLLYKSLIILFKSNKNPLSAIQSQLFGFVAGLKMLNNTK